MRAAWRALVDSRCAWRPAAARAGGPAGRLPALLAGLLATGVVVALPGMADACAVCFSGEDEARLAFIWTALFLTVLPFVLIGGVVGWIRRRVRLLETEPWPPGSSPLPVPGPEPIFRSGKAPALRP